MFSGKQDLYHLGPPGCQRGRRAEGVRFDYLSSDSRLRKKPTTFNAFIVVPVEHLHDHPIGACFVFVLWINDTLSIVSVIELDDMITRMWDVPVNWIRRVSSSHRRRCAQPVFVLLTRMSGAKRLTCASRSRIPKETENFATSWRISSVDSSLSIRLSMQPECLVVIRADWRDWRKYFNKDARSD